MKKLNLKGKLSFNKETIVKLNNEQMAQVVGGQTNGTLATCCGGPTCIWQGTLCNQDTCYNTCEGPTCTATQCTAASCAC
jgi:hypothetical protein